MIAGRPSAEQGERNDADDLRRAYRRRYRMLCVVVGGLALSWYGFLVLESLAMGHDPFARRPFTVLDGAYALLLAVAIPVAIRRIRRCPRCGEGFGFRSVERCPGCEGRVS